MPAPLIIYRFLKGGGATVSAAGGLQDIVTKQNSLNTSDLL